MKLTQLSVFLENREGRLARVARILGEANINIVAMSLADTSDFGILRMIVNDVEKAQEVLRLNNFTCAKTAVIAADVPNVPGGLATVLELIDRSKLNIEYMYALSEPHTGKTALIFRFDDLDKALAEFQADGIAMLSAADLLKN